MSKSNFSSQAEQNINQIFVLDAPSLERDKLVHFLQKKQYVVSVFSTSASLFQAKEMKDSSLSVLLSNIDLPNMDGLDVLERLKMTGLNIPVIFYGKVQSVSKGVTAVKLGALDFLLMPAEDASIIKAIEDGLNLSAEQYAIFSTRQTLQTKLNVLSPREQEVFYLLIKGYSNAELVSSLRISLDTVKQYKTSVMRKLEAKSLSQLMGLVALNAVPAPTADALEGRS